MKGANLFLTFIIITFLFSCKRQKEDVSIDSNYKLFNLEQAGWKSKSISHNFNNISYTATMVPIQYYILKELGNVDSEIVDSIYEVNKLERIVEIEFEHATKDDLLKGNYTHMDYESAVKYMSFKIERDFIAVTQSGDSINCSGVTFERNFKVAPFKRMLLHFGNVPEEEQLQLVYMDRLFGNGILKFKFQETPLKL